MDSSYFKFEIVCCQFEGYKDENCQARKKTGKAWPDCKDVRAGLAL